jgi:hypothetical protein
MNRSTNSLLELTNHHHCRLHFDSFSSTALAYSSAILMVLHTHESWLKIQHNLRRRMDGKQRWLNVVKSDLESIELSGSTLEAIRQKAQAILSQFNAENETRSAPNAKCTLSVSR